MIIKRTLLMHLVDQAFSQGMRDIYGDMLRTHIRTGMLGYIEEIQSRH